MQLYKHHYITLERRHFGDSCDEIMSLTHPYIDSVIPIRIGYAILHIDIIILETSNTKYNLFNLVYHPPYA